MWRIHNDGRLEYYAAHAGKGKAPSGGRFVEYPAGISPDKISFAYPDRQGNLWLIGTYCIYRLSFNVHKEKPILQGKPLQVKALMAERNGNFWITTKEDASVRLYDKHLNLIGYLSRNGHISAHPTPFVAPVYSMMRDSRGCLWLGCKPGGLIRLMPGRQGQMQMTHIKGLNNTAVYDMKEDRWHRLWVATLGGGVNCVENMHGDAPSVYNSDNAMKHYPAGFGRVRTLEIIQRPAGSHRDMDVLLAATTSGLLVAEIGAKTDFGKLHFARHRREANRPAALAAMR